MHLISSLAAGIRGAENGTLRLFVRATSTRAVFYEDFVGNVHPNSGQDVTLDANGSALIYVNQFVDVVVLDRSGTEVRNFVDGYSSPNIEVTSNAFTGIDYTSSASGTNKPTNLQSVMDLWRTTNGAPDWKVLVGGGAVSVRSAVAGVAGIFINVKDPTYGALGDNATDDTTAIQNALNAAQAADGGIVVFPSGTYLVTAKLSVPVAVSLWGLGAEASIIKMNHATADLLEYGAGTSTSRQEIRGLGISVAQANTGKLISMTAAGFRYLLVVNSVVGDTGGLHSGDIVSHLKGGLTISDCLMWCSGSGGVNSGAGYRMDIRNTAIRIPGAGAYNGSLVKMNIGTLIGSEVDASVATSGTYEALFVDGTSGAPQVQILGNILTGSTNGTSIAIQIGNLNSATTSVIEAANTFAGWDVNYGGWFMQTNNPQIQNSSRDSKIRQVTDNSAAVDLLAELYGTVVLTRTAAGGAQAFSATVGAPGARLMLIIYNNSGGALGADPTFGGGGFYVGTPAITKPSNTKISVAEFVAVYAAGTGCWCPIAAYKTDF